MDGIDIRSDGGYIVAPPSVHQNGHTYEWEQNWEDIELADMNDLVRYFVTATQDKGHENARNFVVPSKVSEGNRNDTIFRLACSLQSKGMTDDAIFAACLKENEKAFDPPLSDDEVRAAVTSCVSRFDKGVKIYFDLHGEAHEEKHTPELTKNKEGKIMQTVANYVEAIEYDDQLFGKIKYNEMAYAPFIIGSVPWDMDESNYREWNNFDDSNIRSYIQDKYGLKPTNMDDALNVLQSRHRYNPLKECLEAAHNSWDHKNGHIRKLLPSYLGAEDSGYTYEVMKIFMLGAISRAYKPGCKFDYTLVLVGDQGCGKSTFLRYLAMGNSWYSDNFNSIEGDKASEKLRGMWIVEMAELLAAKRAKDVEAIKAFLTSTSDTYRPPWGRRTEQRPRVCVFSATTNNDQFLADRTGNRRFLPICVKRADEQHSILDRSEELSADVLQAWGEAMEIYMASNGNVPLRLPDGIEDEASEMQAEHTEEDPRIGIIQSWLSQHEQENVCAMQICIEALGYERQDVDKKTTAPICVLMRESIQGWSPVGLQHTRDYGRQRCYARNSELIELAPEECKDLPF